MRGITTNGKSNLQISGSVTSNSILQHHTLQQVMPLARVLMVISPFLLFRDPYSLTDSGAPECLIRGKDSTTDINICLFQILEDYKRHLDKNHWWKSKPKPLSLFIFTDGVWEKEVTASEPIKSVVAKLEDLRKDKRQIGIQFISFGSDPAGLGQLEHLDDRLNISK